jgi:hypothetical protein
MTANTDPAMIAMGLSAEQREIILAPEAILEGPYALRPAKAFNLPMVGLVKRSFSNAPYWNLTPLGLRVRDLLSKERI